MGSGSVQDLVIGFVWLTAWLLVIFIVLRPGDDK